ncbi:MAG: exo-alpha-sialidase [Acidimicrobiia bacterium]|nr:exo-alpha-sialidase [Acidimicrobiia bacterium]
MNRPNWRCVRLMNLVLTVTLGVSSPRSELWLAANHLRQAQSPATAIEKRIVPGSPVTPSLTQAYDPEKGQRFVVNAEHRIPADMIVQGDSVILRAKGLEATQVREARWTLKKASGKPVLTAREKPLEAVFRADGFGENLIEFSALAGGKRITAETTVVVEFSTANMLVSRQRVSMPTDEPSKPFVRRPPLEANNHREQCTARNPHTGRLVTFWQVNYLEGQPDEGPMGVAVMQSGDHGVTWTGQRYLYSNYPDNSGWGTIGWNQNGNDGKGEFLLFTCSHVRSPGNRLMLFRSRDDGDSWQHLGDYQSPIAKEFQRDNALLTYFGVNRMVATKRGTLVAPTVNNYYVRALWSDDNGASWHSSNLNQKFPQGDENAIVETANGGKLILLARPHGGGSPIRNHRFESTDGGRNWSVAGKSTLPTAGVNLGLDKIAQPGQPQHGHVLYASAATRTGPHKGRQRTVLAINDDAVNVDESRWDVRLLWDGQANYSDVLYLPEDRSIFVSIETIQPGKESPLGYEAIRYFKLSYRYWQHLPRYKVAFPGQD